MDYTHTSVLQRIIFTMTDRVSSVICRSHVSASREPSSDKCRINNSLNYLWMGVAMVMSRRAFCKHLWAAGPSSLGYLCSILAICLSWITGADCKVFATQMSPRVVDTQYGQLRGLLVTLPNPHLPQVDAYLGLQYASVLGGDLRFMPPTSPLENWDGIKVAMQFRPVCPQKLPDLEKLEKNLPLGRVDHYKRILPFLGRQAEECLNLNVYVPVRGKSDTCI